MHRILLFLLLCVASIPCRADTLEESGAHVLFVGNSLTYVANTPAVYSALAAANGHPARSDMIVRGGATLAERVADGSVERALAQGRYTALVIQERGGELLCAFGPESCAQSRAAIAALAEMASRKGVRLVLLGSYQAHPAASRELVEKEREAANEAGIAYAQISDRLLALREVEPGLAWFAEDGTHPGTDLALLNALVLYEVLHGRVPQVGPLRVRAPIHGPTSGLDETLRRADGPPPLPDTPSEVYFPAETTAKLLRAATAAEGDVPSAIDCTATRLRRFVGPTGVRQAWPEAGALPPGLVEGGVLLSDTGMLADGYSQWLVIDAANRAAYVIQSGGFAGFHTIYGPLPVAACTAPAR